MRGHVQIHVSLTGPRYDVHLVYIYVCVCVGMGFLCYGGFMDALFIVLSLIYDFFKFIVCLIFGSSFTVRK